MKIRIGEIAVDAGIVWVGDPCYVLHKEPGESYSGIGNSWRDFCNKLSREEAYTQFNFSGDSTGLGVCVRSGYGDGVYPVYAEIIKGVVHKVWVDFMGEEDELD